MVNETLFPSEYIDYTRLTHVRPKNTSHVRVSYGNNNNNYNSQQTRRY